ncbi:MAG: sulfatase [bacterium]|nr:sulfatase [bacterium]
MADSGLVDTLRADHLGCYGYPRPTSPAIDAFADEAVLFENTLAQSSWTRSSVASMMTGTVPTVHGVHDRDDALAAEAKTLAELLAAESYETAAFLTNRSVGPSFGFQQGFDTFELFDRQETEALYPKSDAVNREVFQWLDERGEEPFFLYVHTMDPHAPYAPPAEMREEIAPDVGSGELDTEEQVVFEELLASRSTRFGESSAFGSVTWLQALGQGLIAATPERTADLVALYDAEISFNDRSFGIFLDQLRRRGLYDDALIFFVGDHGEEFADHGGWSHGLTLFQEQLRVPFLVKLPAGAHGGTRSRELAQHVDLMPTVLDALGLPLPDDVQGRSLLPSPRSTASEPRPGYSHLDLDGRRAASLVEGRFKLTCDQTIDETCRVYDLENDPAESIDLTAERPVLAGYLRSRMRTFQTEAPALDAPQVEIDPELRERLEALGYL